MKNFVIAVLVILFGAAAAFSFFSYQSSSENQEALRRAQAELANKKEILLELEDKVSKLRREKSKVERKIRELEIKQKTTIGLNNNFKIKKHEITRLKEKIHELQTALDKARPRLEQADELNAKVGRLEKTLADARANNQEMVRLQSKVEELHKYLEEAGLKERQISRLKDKLKELERTLVEARHKNEEMASLQLKIVELESMVDKTQLQDREIERLKSKFEELSNILADVKQKEIEIDDMMDQVQSLKTDLNKARLKENEVVRLEAKVSQLEEVVAPTKSKDERISLLNSKINEFQKDLEKAQYKDREITLLHERIRELNKVVVEIKLKDQELSQLINKIKELKADLEKARLKEREITRLEGRIRNLEKVVAAAKPKDRQISDLKLKIGELEKIIEECLVTEKEVLDLKNKISEINQVMVGLRAGPAAVGSGSGIAVAAIEEPGCKIAIDKLRTDLNIALERHQSLTRELGAKNLLTIELEARLKDNQSSLVALEDRLGQVTGQLGQCREVTLQLKKDKALTDKEIEEIKNVTEEMLSGLKKQIESQEVKIRNYQQQISMTFIDSVLFGSGSASITPQGKIILSKVGSILKMAEGERGKLIRVIGHTDNVPLSKRSKYSTNWELSAARAVSVIEFLKNESKLNPEGMEAVGRSYFEPVADNDTDTNRALNRRVEIIIGPRRIRH